MFQKEQSGKYHVIGTYEDIRTSYKSGKNSITPCISVFEGDVTVDENGSLKGLLQSIVHTNNITSTHYINLDTNIYLDTGNFWNLWHLFQEDNLYVDIEGLTFKENKQNNTHTFCFEHLVDTRYQHFSEYLFLDKVDDII